MSQSAVRHIIKRQIAVIWYKCDMGILNYLKTFPAFESASNK